MTSLKLAIANLSHQRGRTAISVLGTSFAVILMLMQFGFLGSVHNTATLLYDQLRFDLILISKEYRDISSPGMIARDRLPLAAGLAGAEAAYPVSFNNAMWRNPLDRNIDPANGGRKYQIAVLAIDPSTTSDIFLPQGQGVFRSEAELEEKQALMSRWNVVLFDRKSRPDFGEPSEMPAGIMTELNGQEVELGGYFDAGTGFSYTGLLLMSEETYDRYVSSTKQRVTFGLIQLPPGADPDQVARYINENLPIDVQVKTRAEILEQEITFWTTKIPVGQFFLFGVVLALIVGVIFIYQMMMADIKNHLSEYATLKAMGYKFRFMFLIVFWQAVLIALASFVVGFAVSMVAYKITVSAARLPMWMTVDRAVLVFFLTQFMCIGSGLVAVRKVQTADPADLF